MPDSAGSQFFIMHKKSPHLDGDYAGFGKIIEGMDEIDKIAKAKVRKPKKVTPGYKKKMKFEMDKVKRQERRKRK